MDEQRQAGVSGLWMSLLAAQIVDGKGRESLTLSVAESSDHMTFTHEGIGKVTLLGQPVGISHTQQCTIREHQASIYKEVTYIKERTSTHCDC